MAKDDEPLPPMWMAWLLGAVAVGLVVLLVIAVRALATAGAPVCNTDFPARRGDYPSWAYVFGAIGAFVVGSVTAQIGIRRQGRSRKELGEGRWANHRAVIAVNAGVAGFLFLVTVLMVIEAWTLGHGVWPITYYVRCSMDAGALISLIGVLSYSFIIGRWMWVFKERA
jgi:hypothetical protein